MCCNIIYIYVSTYTEVFMTYYVIFDPDCKNDYNYCLILDSTFQITKYRRFSKFISGADFRRTFTSFVKNEISSISEKKDLYFYPQAAFGDKNDWGNLFNSFKTVDVLGVENTPAFALILNRINQAYEFTLKQSLNSMDPSQQTKILKEGFIQKYQSLVSESTFEFSSEEKNFSKGIPDEVKLTKEIFLEKIILLENLLENTLNLSTGKRQQFTRILLESKKHISFFDDYDLNKVYLKSFFINLLNVENVLEYMNINLVLIDETKQFISLKQFNQIFYLAGQSMYNRESGKYSEFEPTRLRIIYFLLYISGLKAKQLAYLDYNNIKKLLDKNEIEFKERGKEEPTKVHLKDFQKELYTDLEIEKEIDIFFVQQKKQYLGEAIFTKGVVKDLTRYLKVINNDLEAICTRLQFKKLTTQHFRHTFVLNLLRKKTFSEIEKEYPYLKHINKKTYL
jgi:hypothetical protein